MTGRAGVRARVRELAGEVVRFTLVGGLATVVALGGFNVLVHGIPIDAALLSDDPITAYVLANLAGGAVAYLGLRVWAFSHRDAGDTVASVMKFFALGAATMVIPVLCLAVSRYLLGLSSVWADNIAANVIGLGLGNVARFVLFRRFVFLGTIQVREAGST